LPGFVYCVGRVTSISCPQKSIRHGNKDALYETGIFIEYHGHPDIKFHVFSRTNASREIWNGIQTKALKGVVHFTYGAFHMWHFNRQKEKRNMTPIEDNKQETYLLSEIYVRNQIFVVV